MTDERQLIEGQTLRIGRRDYVVPPLNLRGVKRALALIPKVDTVDSPESIDAALEILLLALARNYPDVTLDQLEEEIDLGNLMGVVQAVLGIAGFTPKAPGEVAATAGA